MAAKGDLRLEVAPNIVEHLGLNLYTNLPRVLVEFVANAYDADSPYVDVRIDFEQIKEARRQVRTEWRNRIEAGEITETDCPLEEQNLPDDVRIEIEDRGHGMGREDLQNKFLRIARKRRKEDQGRSPNGRVVMGRKGIGKLAGFGIAHRVEVVSRAPGEPHATKITLDYEELIGKEKTENVRIPTEVLEDGAGIEPSGTRIILSRLLIEPTGSREQTIQTRISRHFILIKPEDFEICVNGDAVPPFTRKYAYAYPEGPAIDELVEKTITVEDRVPETFQYRIRFTPRGQHLSSAERGVRVYAHKRLASVPDLLDLTTGMHGFQNTHYLDAVVVADFVDERRSADYIASNRQTLRWGTPLLAEMRRFLTEEMTVACTKYQKTKDKTISARVKGDEFTKKAIEAAKLPSHRKKMAFQLAAKLASGCGDEMEDKFYRETLPSIALSLGYGQILTAIGALAKSQHPSFPELVAALADLTAAEWDDFARVVSGRLSGIKALREIYATIDFQQPNNEDELHKLLKESPWLIDPTFCKFLTSNVTEKTLSDHLSKALGIDAYVPEDYDPEAEEEVKPLGKNRRPDLVFLLSNYALGRVVIVELKAPNTPLHHEHLMQLRDYMRDTEEILEAMKGVASQLKVEGYLIGTRAVKSKALQVERLRAEEKEAGPVSPWRVFDIHELLERAENAHRELLDIYERVSEPEEDA